MSFETNGHENSNFYNFLPDLQVFKKNLELYPPQASNRSLFFGTNILMVVGLLVLLWSNRSFLILED